MRAAAFLALALLAGCVTTVAPPATNGTPDANSTIDDGTPAGLVGSYLWASSSPSLTRVFAFHANGTVVYESWGTSLPAQREAGSFSLTGSQGLLTTPAVGKRALRVVDGATIEIAGERYALSVDPPRPPAPTGGAAPAGPVCVSTLDARAGAQVEWALNTTMGLLRLTLFCAKTPRTAQHFVNLTEAGYFDGVKFHRVIEAFMIQGGDPLTKNDSLASRWGTGGPGFTIVDEFWCGDGKVSTAHPAACGAAGLGLKHDAAGTLSMANTGRPRSGGSQFFVTAGPTPHLDGKHAVFGRTADAASLEVALAINRVETNAQDRPVVPVVIHGATIVWP